MARPAGDISSRIVRAARRRFLEHGVDGAALRQIASDAGTNIGMIYYYFKTKDELFLAAIEEVYARLVEDMQRVLRTDAPIEERLRLLYERLSAIDAQEVDVLRMVLREALTSSDRMLRLAHRFESGHLPLLVELVAEGTRTQRLRDDLHPLVVMAATVLLGLIPQLAHRIVSASPLPIREQLPPPAQAADDLLQVLLRGVAGPRASKRRKG